jgi:hypothetical protein
MISAIFNNGLIQVYIDGQLILSYLSSVSIVADSPEPLRIGDCFFIYNQNYKTFHGTLDDVRIYNRALSASEVQEIYNSPNPLAPTAVAGADQVVFDTATLDGRGSYDSTGTIVSYNWQLQHRQSSFSTSAQGETAIVPDLQPGFYDVILTVTDDKGSTGSDTMLLAVAGSCFCSANKMHIQSILAETNKGKYGRVRVTVFDNCGNPVPSAQVNGTFSGDFNENGSAITDDSGVAVVYTAASVAKPSYTFCVDSVVKGTMPYEPANNVETCKTK